jgi:hypothetical protein
LNDHSIKPVEKMPKKTRPPAEANDPVSIKVQIENSGFKT